jgi:hypothetical protein
MSFGFAIGDFIAVGQLAWTLYRDCYTIARGAPQEFQLLRGEISTLANSLKMLQEEVSDPSSTLVQAGEDRVRMVNEVVSRLNVTLKELQNVARNYKILGTGSKGKQIWVKFKWSVEFSSIDSLRSKALLVYSIASLYLQRPNFLGFACSFASNSHTTCPAFPSSRSILDSGDPRHL